MKNIVLKFLQTIPQSKVITYKSLAQQFHSHPRAIACILASNTQQDIYPCYKVVCSDRTLGGYNLGLDEKIRRLQKDHIIVIDNKVAEHCIRNPIDNKV